MGIAFGSTRRPRDAWLASGSATPNRSSSFVALSPHSVFASAHTTATSLDRRTSRTGRSAGRCSSTAATGTATAAASAPRRRSGTPLSGSRSSRRTWPVMLVLDVLWSREDSACSRSGSARRPRTRGSPGASRYSRRSWVTRAGKREPSRQGQNPVAVAAVDSSTSLVNAEARALRR